MQNDHAPKPHFQDALNRKSPRGLSCLEFDEQETSISNIESVRLLQNLVWACGVRLRILLFCAFAFLRQYDVNFHSCFIILSFSATSIFLNKIYLKSILSQNKEIFYLLRNLYAVPLFGLENILICQLIHMGLSILAYFQNI